MSDRTFYVTTPIYYVNARPHIGHAYTTIVADVLARRHRLLGEKTYFLTGTDEHGQKIERSAAAAGVAPQAFADQVSRSFEDLWRRMGITHNDFIRTTSSRHKLAVQHLFATLYERGFIELRTYTGQYCVSDEAFVEVAPGEPCPECGRITETLSEENFFFKLSAFQRPLIDLIESGQLAITPETRRNEVLSFLKGGLKDLSISRSSFTWGIPVPEPAAGAAAQKHVIYVWMDALANYITALGYGSSDDTLFRAFWPANVQLVGKEIIRFHCIYWPAFLLALNPRLQHNSSEEPPILTAEEHGAWAREWLPKAVTAHGWLLFEESKMSKSRGNIVRTETILDAFGPLCPQLEMEPAALGAQHGRDLFASDVLRYFLLREIPFGQDGGFSFDALITRYNADLANGYGNLVSRTLNMIAQYFAGSIPSPSLDRDGGQDPARKEWRAMAEAIRDDFQAVQERLHPLFDRFAFNDYLSEVMRLISRIDNFLSASAPWKLAKSSEEEDRRDLATTLFVSAQGIRLATALLHPVLPFATARVWAQLGLGSIEESAAQGRLKLLHWADPKAGAQLGALTAIFPRADKGLAQKMTEMESPIAPAPIASTPAEPAAAPAAAIAPEEQSTLPSSISIDDFARIEMRVAQIAVAERIPKADKLLRLEVDLGNERRQILSGIAEWYTPEDLLGRRIIVITNLAPRKMRGLESHGMLLAASQDGGKPYLATVPDEAPLGSRLK
ncbi:MAG: methionine--tRNA ligase subunit beta [Acidobacteriota bacterium]